MTDELSPEEMMLRLLAAPFPVDEVEWRVDGKPVDTDKGKRSRCVCYIDARAVMERLDRVLPPFSWSTEYRVLPDGKHVECRLTILGVTRADVGETNEGGFADGMKSAYSDALKRVAVQFGVGRQLYAIPAQWADVDAKGYITQRALEGLQRAYSERTGTAPAVQQREPVPDAEVAVQAQVARQAAQGGKAVNWTAWWNSMKQLNLTPDYVRNYVKPKDIQRYSQDELNVLYGELVRHVQSGAAA